MSGDRPTAKTPFVARVQAIFFFAAAIGYPIAFANHEQVWWNLGMAVFLFASGLLCWSGLQILASSRDVQAAKSIRGRRLLVTPYLVSLALLGVSILRSQQVVPSVVFGSASLGMALLIAKLPSLVPPKPAA